MKDASRALRLGSLVLVASCGGRLDVPAPNPTAYKVAYIGTHNNVHVWHSTTAADEPLGNYGGNPCFTHDGSRLAAVPIGAGHQLASAVALFSVGGVVDTVTLPEVADGPCPRSDAKRFVLNDPANTSECLSIFDVASGTTSPIACKARHAAYAADDNTLVFAHAIDGTTDELVTMHDDSTGEEIVVPAEPGRTIRDPAFSFDGASIVFMHNQGSDLFYGPWEIKVVERASHTVTIIATVTDPAASSPQLTPDGTAIVFLASSTTDNYALKKVQIATGEISIVVPDLHQDKLVYLGPQFRISLAPE